MKLAVITDSSAYLPQHLLHHDDLFILDIPIYIDGESYVEGKNLTHDEFYQRWLRLRNYQRPANRVWQR